MNWNKIIKLIQNTLYLIVLSLIAVSVLSLIAFDTIIGSYFVDHFTGHREKVLSIFFSFATTGLTLGLAFFAYMAATADKIHNKALVSVIQGAGKIAVLLSVVGWILDIYLDSLSADYFVFNTLVIISTLSEPTKTVMYVIRILIGIMSIVGEPIAIAVIGGMGVLKEFISDKILGNVDPSFSYDRNSRNQPRHNRNRPTSILTPRDIMLSKSPTKPTPVPSRQNNTEEPTYHPISWQPINYEEGEQQ